MDIRSALTELCEAFNAHDLEQNGQPEGREDEFWHLAEQELLNEDKSSAHIPGLATIVQCNCGAEYNRTEDKFLVPHTGDVICTVCGAALESWRESTHVPTYELIERPERKPE